MAELPLYQVDAFADRPFTGNPAAVLPLAEWLPDEILQAIAMENNLSETAFTVPAPDDPEADYELRWFTPAVEVVLCGHATLASGHVLIGERDRVRFRTRKAGLLEVARGELEAYAMSLPAYRPEPKPLPRVVAALGAEPAETLWHPGLYALIVFGDEAEVRALEPDFRALAAEGDILTICTAPGSTSDVASRVFAPAAGIDEDPVTGSAHAVLTPYWAARLGRNRFSAYQASRRGGMVDCRLDGDRAILGGRCITMIEGTLRF
ncbi:MAG TPA: PhzF family phenazine biosynthesis protein [Allosphingosinicella sp.]|nr:PhzF family phenazine biosynthesis protein [Allosphingosinicella sp.]